MLFWNKADEKSILDETTTINAHNYCSDQTSQIINNFSIHSNLSTTTRDTLIFDYFDPWILYTSLLIVVRGDDGITTSHCSLDAVSRLEVQFSSESHCSFRYHPSSPMPMTSHKSPSFRILEILSFALNYRVNQVIPISKHLLPLNLLLPPRYEYHPYSHHTMHPIEWLEKCEYSEHRYLGNPNSVRVRVLWMLSLLDMICTNTNYMNCWQCPYTSSLSALNREWSNRELSSNEMLRQIHNAPL